MIKVCFPDNYSPTPVSLMNLPENSRQVYIEQPGYKKPAITEPALKARNMNNRG
jgi:hypothetical protein